MEKIKNKFIGRIFKIPIIGNLIAYFLYIISRLIVVLIFWSSDGKRLKLGKCVIWTSKDREQIILAGIECLRIKDPDLFLCLPRITFFYSKANMRLSGGPTYALEEQFVKYGPEGIAVAIVQAIFLFRASPKINRFSTTGDERIALKNVPQKVTEWACQHSIQEIVIKAYRIGSDKWIAKNFS